MTAMDDTALAAAFNAHTAGLIEFTRRMVIALADMDGTTPRQLVRRCEQLGLCKPWSWEWFEDNGGITDEHIAQARAQRRLAASTAGRAG